VNKSGFTLVELMTSITLIGIISTFVVAFGVNGLANYNYSYNRSVLLDQAHLGVRNVSEAILQSASADNNNRVEDQNGPGAPGNLFGWQSDGDTLVLATAAENTEGDILFEDESHYISYKNNLIYFLDEGDLKRRVLAADVPGNKAVTTCPEAAASASCPQDTTILEDVDSFSVTYYDSQNQEVAPNSARSVELAISLSKEVQNRNISAEYSTRTVFRND